MPPQQSLEGRRALITGGTRGIGRAIAVALAESGADVGIVGRDAEGLKATRELVEGRGRACLMIQEDLATAEGARAAGQEALRHGTWDIVVNNAGIASSAALLEVDLDTWDAVQALNLRAVVVLCQVMVPPMLERGRGKVVNVSSAGAFLGTPGLGAYAASKAALNQLTRTMAVEWGPHGVQANAVCPTVVLTEMGRSIWDDPARAADRRAKEQRIPAHHFGAPDDVAGAVTFLASPASDYVNGVALPVDGGMLVAP
jgi:NAD(P)-dependent dehydrogenase (short-subunit alcohol dehydrogenase family)